jgi:hypothetical protein
MTGGKEQGIVLRKVLSAQAKTALVKASSRGVYLGEDICDLSFCAGGRWLSMNI